MFYNEGQSMGRVMAVAVLRQCSGFEKTLAHEHGLTKPVDSRLLINRKHGVAIRPPFTTYAQS